MTDKQFLNWIADRFVHVHGESENVDFVQRLRAIAESLEERTTDWRQPPARRLHLCGDCFLNHRDTGLSRLMPVDPDRCAMCGRSIPVVTT